MVMDFRKILDKFKWKPEKEYSFSLPDTDKQQNNEYFPDKNLNFPKEVFSSINKNLDYIKVRFNTLINTDIVIREFVLNACGKNYNSFLLFIDGMVDSNLISDFVLKPLMRNNISNCQPNIIEEKKINNVTIRKIKKVDLSDFLYNNLLPQNNVSKKSNFDAIVSSVNSGNCILFVDSLNIAFDIEVKGFKQRSVDSPNNEVVIKGPQEAFVENIRTNTSLLRRIVNSEKLIIENVEIGDITKTKCSICYLENISNSDLVAEIKFRISNLDIDSLLSSRSIGGTHY